MHRCQNRDAVRSGRFHFRAVIGSSGTEQPGFADVFSDKVSINDIINGPTDALPSLVQFPGFIPLIRRYLAEKNVAAAHFERIMTYVEFVGRRASGECMTVARWIREFIDNHPAYLHDSIVNDEVTYDLCKAAQDIVEKKNVPCELFGSQLAAELLSSSHSLKSPTGK
jgi:glutamate--cysteine ligase catalytic subunit